MIKTVSLTKYFGRRKAVDDFSVEIGNQRIVGFLGLNGAGKTTTLRMLAGLLSPSEGRVYIQGADLHGKGGSQARSQIGYLPDRPPLYDDMTVRGFLAFAGKLRGASPTTSRLNEVLEQTGLEAFQKTPIARLSHGYRQRLGVAQAIIHNPALVVLDEPTNGLDPKQIVDMRKLIAGLASAHTVLLSSHNLPEVEECCDEILVIDEGKLAARGSPKELQEQLDAGTGLIRVVAIGTQKQFDKAVKGLEIRGLEVIDPETRSFELVATEPAEALSTKLFKAGLQLRRFNPVVDSVQFLFDQLTSSRREAS